MENIDKNLCCGCNACIAICPKKAIKMELDEYNNEYPVVDKKKCINCNLCSRVCAYKNKETSNNVLKTYASACKNDNLLRNSSSGGVFIAIATDFIDKNGIVYGCSMENENNIITPKHIRVDKKDDLFKLQGSKYAKSVVDSLYTNIKDDLSNNKKVLFSGTPCQVHALISFLELTKTKIDNLFTIDIICHGTPSTKMFQDYIKELEKKKNKRIINFKFRDKKYSWGLLGTIFYDDNTTSPLYITESSYYHLFLEGKTYRENCYTCKYASKNRVGDITIGDYWGIDEEHPELLLSNGGNLDLKKGVSCILVNSKKGEYIVKEFGKELIINESEFEKVSKNNQQLKKPVSFPGERETILEEYKKKGYKGIDNYYKKKCGFKRFLYPIYHKVKEVIIFLKNN